MERILSESDLLKRESGLDERIEQLRHELAELESAKAKIKVAKELLGQYGITNGHSGANVEATQQSNREESIVRPEGIPTTREMVLWIVRDANHAGKGPTQLEIVEGIRKKWWPNAPPSRIRPMIWSLWKVKGILTRRKNGEYFVEPVKRNEAPTAQAVEPQ